MQRFCLVIADASRARLYAFEERAAPPGEHGLELEQRIDLVNLRRCRPSELLPDTRPGASRAPGPRSERRGDYLRDLDRKFACDIVHRLARMSRETESRRAIVAAPPRMLALLREEAEPLRRSGISLDEVDGDLSLLTSAPIEDHLSLLGLLPAPEPPRPLP